MMMKTIFKTDQNDGYLSMMMMAIFEEVYLATADDDDEDDENDEDDDKDNDDKDDKDDDDDDI